MSKYKRDKKKAKEEVRRAMSAEDYDSVWLSPYMRAARRIRISKGKRD